MRRVGIFGGAFDPVHLGHIIPALQADETFRFDELVFIPAARPPHKQGEEMTAFSHRFAMLALATMPYDRFLVSDIELAGSGPTYTVDTVRRFAASTAADHLFFLMGSDSFAQIATWHEWRELVRLASLVVLHRDTVWGHDLAAQVPAELLPRLEAIAPRAVVADPAPGETRIYLLDHEPHPVAARHLRERLRAGDSVRALVPPEVHRYIVKHRLYLGGEGTRDGT